MFSLIAFTASLPFVTAYCSDSILFEKNKITEYTKISSRSSRMHSESLLPALEWVEDLEKNGFGTHTYERLSVDANGVFMLYAYKPKLGILAYHICDSVPENITGPLLYSTHAPQGYRFKVNDFHRLNKHFVNYNFKVFGQDETALRDEIREDRKDRILENRRLRARMWEERGFLSKFVSTFWVPLVIILIFMIGH